MSYWIQLTTHRLARQTVYRAQVLQGSLPIATTVNAWPENGGCGKAAAIGEARVLQAQLEWQRWHSIATNSLKSVTIGPIMPVKGNQNSMKATVWFLVCLVVAACGIGLQGCEQSSLNPHTDSCDYIQRLENGPVQVVCTTVQHVR